MFGNLLNVGLENEDLGLDDISAAEVEDVVDETLEAGETVEAAETEVAEAVDEAEDAGTTMDALVDATEDLGEVEAALEHALENGGMTEDGARGIAPMMKSLNRRLGAGSPLSRSAPSVESFGATGGRLEATQASLEAVRDTLDQIIKTIVEYWNKAKTAIKNFWVKLWDQSPRIQKRLEALAKAAGGVQGQAKKADVEGGFAKVLVIDGSHPGSIVNEMKKTVSVLSSELTTVTDAEIQAAGDIGKALEALAKGEGDVGDPAHHIFVMKEINSKGREVSGLKGIPANYKIVVGRDALLGNRKTWFGVSAADGKDINRMSTLRSGLVETSKKAAEAAAKQKSMKTLSPEDAKALAEAAASGCTVVNNYRKDWDRREKAVTALKDKATAVVKAMKSKDDKAAVKGARTGAKDLGRFTRGMFGGAEEGCRHMLVVAKAAGEYCAASLRQYKGEPAAAASGEGDSV